jgi:hypothetical protein
MKKGGKFKPTTKAGTPKGPHEGHGHGSDEYDQTPDRPQPK